VTYENYIKAKLVDFAAQEACHHGRAEGMLAVAQVLANRVKAGWGEWHKIIATAPDYIGTTQPPAKIDPRDISFRTLLGKIDDIYNGTADDSGVNIEDDRGTMLALYYAELNNIDRRWFHDNITTQLERHPRIANVGPLTFFA
jgi:hypothetical protein